MELVPGFANHAAGKICPEQSDRNLAVLAVGSVRSRSEIRDFFISYLPMYSLSARLGCPVPPFSKSGKSRSGIARISPDWRATLAGAETNRKKFRHPAYELCSRACRSSCASRHLIRAGDLLGGVSRYQARCPAASSAWRSRHHIYGEARRPSAKFLASNEQWHLALFWLLRIRAMGPFAS